MPTKTPAWASKDGMLFATAEQASRRDLFVVLTEISGMNSESASAVIDTLMANSDTIMEALTTTSSSRPAARKRAGTTNPKRATKRLATEPVTPPQQEAA